MLGGEVAKLHNFGILHGDLSLQNTLVEQEGPKKGSDIFVVGFHLATTSEDLDDKAVDLKLFCKIP